MTRRLLLASLSLIAFAGCATMAPEYSRPAAPVPSAWPTGPAYGTEATKHSIATVVDNAWSGFFIDESLRVVIARALANNRDLRVAALNIERSRAMYQIRRADLLPSVNATGGSSAQRVPETLSGKGEAITTHTYDVGVGVSGYELDLFGRVRSLKGRALEEYFATEQARRSVQISLVSEVAGRWLALVADRDRLRLAGETLKAQEKSYELTKRRFEAGVSSELDLRQSQIGVESAKVDIARYTSVVAQNRNALEFLAGGPVPDDMLPTELNAVGVLPELSPGLPSEVLTRRPDILEAESRLKGANANIGAARAAFFPRITLSTSVGLGSNELGELFKDGAAAWSFVPRITVPIFNAGANRANLKVAETDRDITLAQYEKAIQSAFREVSDALAQRGTLSDQLSAQQSLVDAATVTRKLTEARYEKGVDSYLPVLDAQRTLYAAEQNLIAMRLARLTNRVTLYKVFGGGG